jgi:hypothetical protein
VELNGLKIEVEAVPQNILPYRSKPLFTKEARVNLTEDKRNDLFDKAIRCHLKKFSLVNLYENLTDNEKLDGTYSLAMLVAKTKSHHLQYDMHDIFTIVRLQDDGITPQESQDLYTEYPSISVADVAASNAWYATIPKADKYPYFRENLLLTEKYLENAIEDSLLAKCLEDYTTYPEAERGGPLLFIILMGHLQSNTATAVDYLRKLIDTMRIDSVDGEDVGKVVSLLRTSETRLKNVVDPKTKQSAVPPNLQSTIVKIMQTSSVADFNAFFSALSVSATLDQERKGMTESDALPTTAQLYSLATKRYNTMLHSNEWTATSTRSTKSAFTAGHPPNPNQKCWNCDQNGHTIERCPKPRNDANVSANKVKFYANRKDQKKSPNGPHRPSGPPRSSDEVDVSKMPLKGKWCRPTEQERSGKTYKREIDGKGHYLDRRGKWRPDRFANVASPGSTVVTQSTVPVSPLGSQASPIAATAQTTNVSDRVAFANAQRMMTQAFDAMQASFG